jgi:glucan endo-1,3-alpha-glucosidase
MKYALSIFAALLLLAVATSASAQRRMVFAHYMLTNQDYQGDDDPTQERKIAAYEREIREAQAMGIDGFVLNAGGWFREPYYIRYAAQMFEAALRLHSGFKLFFSADFCCGNSLDDAEDMMRRFAGNPRYAGVYFRYKDAAVLSTFAGDKFGVAGWRRLRSDLATGANPSTRTAANALAAVSGAPSNQPLAVFLVPAFFFGGETPGRADVEKGVAEWKSTLDGVFYWGIAGVPGGVSGEVSGSGGELDTVKSSRAYADALHRAGNGAGMLYMAPVCLQFWGSNANRYYEYSGAKGMRALWMDAIEPDQSGGHPDWVEIITWNDFIEGTYVSPIDDPNKYPDASFLLSSGIPAGTRGYFPSHAGASALLPFFIEWYKTGREPAITRDAVYYFYRTQPKSVDAGKPPVAHKYGPVADVVYITANLTAPAELRVTQGGETHVVKLPAGSTDAEAPIGPGAPPAFTLLRDGKAILSGAGANAIDAAPRYNSYYYSTGVLAAQ